MLTITSRGNTVTIKFLGSDNKYHVFNTNIDGSKVDEDTHKTFDSDDLAIEYYISLKNNNNKGTVNTMYTRINIDQARKLFNDGTEIYMLPATVELIDGIGISVKCHKDTHGSFDEFAVQYRDLSSSKLRYYIESK